VSRCADLVVEALKEVTDDLVVVVTRVVVSSSRSSPNAAR
jgi:hypothetical protein